MHAANGVQSDTSCQVVASVAADDMHTRYVDVVDVRGVADAAANEWGAA